MNLRHLLLVPVLAFVAACSTHAEPAGDSPQPPPTAEQAKPAAPTDVSPALDQLLTAIEAKAASVKTLTARLRHDRIQDLLGDEQRYFGTFVFADGPPPRFHIALEFKIVDGGRRDLDRQWTFDGRWLADRKVEDGVKQFKRYELVPADQADEQFMDIGEGPFVLPLNFRKASILERFNVNLAEPDAKIDPKGEPTVHLILTQREGQPAEHERYDLWWDRETLLPRSASATSDSGDVSVFTLMKVEANVDLKDVSFDTAPPSQPGWDVEIVPLEAPGKAEGE